MPSIGVPASSNSRFGVPSSASKKMGVISSMYGSKMAAPVPLKKASKKYDEEMAKVVAKFEKAL